MITGELHTRKRKIEFSGDNLGSGNVVPSHWYHSIVRPCGKSDTIAITILSEMVFLYRYNNQSQFQLNFHHFKSKFNFGLSQVKDAVIRLKQASLLKRCLRNITVLGRLFVNEMFLILNIENVLSLNKQLEAKKFAYSKGKDDTGCAEISTDNIEEKYLNKKSRSNESNFEKNFLKGGNDFIEAVDVTDSTISFTPTQFSLINPNPSQSLSAFHPLNKDDIEWLKVRSGRDFDMNFISTFIFLVPLLIFSGGMRSYIFYITAVASLQLWTPLNAVINMIIGTYSNLEPGSNMLMSFSTASTASNHIDTIVTVAAGLQTVVPFIAFAMMQGGISGMMHLAGSVIGGLQSTAGGIGSEVATGNRNMDNVSENNVSRHMLNANKTDTNMQYASGAQIAQLADGTTERINPDGSQVLSGGVGSTVSGGETTYHMSEDQTGQVSRGIQSQEAMVRSSQASLSEAESSTFAKTVDRVSSIAQRVHNGENMNFDRSTEEGRALEKTVGIANTLHDKHDYNWQQATESALRGNVSAGIPGKFLGFGATISADGAVSARNTSDQSIGKDERFEHGTNARDNYNNVVKAAQNTSWGQETSSDESQAKAVRSSYEEQVRIEKQLSERQESLNNWHEAKTVIDSRGANSSRDMYQEVLDNCVVEFGLDPISTKKMVDRQHPDVMKVWKRMQTQESGSVQNLVNDIAANKKYVSGESANGQVQNFYNEHHSKVQSDPNEAMNARSSGNNSLNPAEIKNNIDASKTLHQKQFSEMHSHSTAERTNSKQGIEIITIDRANDIKAYEEDRIG